MLVLAVLGPALLAADPVPVGRFLVDPMGNLGSDGVEIHPKALVGLRLDTNPYAAGADTDTDIAGRILAGALLRWNASQAWTWSADLEAEALEYSQEENRDAGMVGGRALVHGRYAGTAQDLDLRGGYERLADPLIETGENIERQTVSALGGWIRQGRANRVDLAVSGRYTDYLEGSSRGSFSEDDRDLLVARVDGSWGRTIGRDDHAYLRLQGERSDYRQNTRFNDSWAAAAALGLTWGLGERARLVGDAGIKVRRYDEAFTDADDDQTVVGPFGRLAVQWPWDEGSRFDLTGYADTDNSLSANAQSVLGVRGDLRWRLRDRLTAIAAIDAVRVRDLGGGEEGRRTTATGEAGLGYGLRSGVVLRGLVRGTVSAATPGDDYDRLETIAELAVVF